MNPMIARTTLVVAAFLAVACAEKAQPIDYTKPLRDGRESFSTAQPVTTTTTTTSTAPAVESAAATATYTAPTVDTTVKTVDMTTASSSGNPFADAEAADTAGSTAGSPANRSVYFALDSSTVEATYQKMLKANSGFITQSGNKVLIQGNTDERGTPEYNLALGQRRSDAVRRSLSQLGVDESLMEAVSFGEEKPKALGHDEAAWRQNRRADIVY